MWSNDYSDESGYETICWQHRKIFLSFDVPVDTLPFGNALFIYLQTIYYLIKSCSILRFTFSIYKVEA